MAVPTRSSNRPAQLSALVGLAGVAALPAAVALSEVSDRVELLQAVAGLCVAAAGLGILALVLARRGRERVRRTVGRAGGENWARVGRALGRLAVAVALAGAIALSFYALLDRWSQ